MKKRILIADADEQFRKELVAAFETCQEYEVIGAAADGNEAFEIAKENRLDIIILDLLLPQYDGITVLGVISDVYPECKVLVVTGFVSDYIISALEDRQVSALLKKPCSAQCIIDRVNKMLQQSTSAGQ